MQNMNRNFFRITRFILLKFPRLFQFFAKFRREQKRLLIIKTDAIGDYILFRNYIEILRASEKFKDYQIDLLGNPLWQDIALKYDRHFINEFYFTKANDLYDKPFATLKLGWRLFKNNYQIVLQPSSTRLFITDGLAALTAAKQIIGFESDNEGILPRYKTKTDKFYTKQFSPPKNIYFEFDKSKFFFENVLNIDISLDTPYIPVNKTEEKGIVIFPGAGVLKRGWEADRFLALIKLISQYSSQTIYIAGGPAEMGIGYFLTENLPQGSINNLTGKTSLPQLVELIGNAALVIANETSAIHIAAATQTKAICILGGGHFGRFAPYPAYMQHKPLCIYEKMDCFNCNWICIFKTEEKAPYPCIANISLEKVWQATLQLLPKA
jgi:ADP-heptose:LPS heptosyltransferase